MAFLTANAKINILQPIENVFDAIIDPKHMSQYFLKESSGLMKTDTKIEWEFPEFTERFPVIVKVIEEPHYISFDWSNGGLNQLVEIKLSPFKGNHTTVEVIEHQMEDTPEGIQQMKQQTEGWSNFLACLKAYIEYGINLRKGAFDFMIKE